MTSVSNISNGALIASNSAAKAQREFSKSIAKLSTGKRALYGADPAGQGIADTLNAKSKSWYVAGRNAEDGISACTNSRVCIIGNSIFSATFKRIRNNGR